MENAGPTGSAVPNGTTTGFGRSCQVEAPELEVQSRGTGILNKRRSVDFPIGRQAHRLRGRGGVSGSRRWPAAATCPSRPGGGLLRGVLSALGPIGAHPLGHRLLLFGRHRTALQFMGFPGGCIVSRSMRPARPSASMGSDSNPNEGSPPRRSPFPFGGSARPTPVVDRLVELPEGARGREPSSSGSDGGRTAAPRRPLTTTVADWGHSGQSRKIPCYADRQ